MQEAVQRNTVEMRRACELHGVIVTQDYLITQTGTYQNHTYKDTDSKDNVQAHCEAIAISAVGPR